MRDIKSDTIQRMEINYHQNGGADLEVTPRTLDRVTAGPDDHAKGIRAVGAQRWRTVCKGWSERENYMKVTKAMELPGLGVLIQCENFQNGQVSGSDPAFVPGARISDNGDGTVSVSANVAASPPDAESALGIDGLSEGALRDMARWLGRLSKLMGEKKGALAYRAVRALAEAHRVARTMDDLSVRLDREGREEDA